MLNSKGVQTQKRGVKEGLYFVDNLDMSSLNHSSSNMKKLYESSTPYANYLNYSKSVGGSATQNRHLKNLWNSMDYKNKPSINERSKKIANSKKTTNISVHERLHQQAVSKQKIEKRDAQNNSFSIEKRFDISELHPTDSKKKNKRKKGKSMHAPYRAVLNYGTRLYQKGVQKLEEVERKHQEAMFMKEQNETRDVTFHPKINPVSYYFGSKGSEKPEDHLIKQGLLTKDKLDQKRSETLYAAQQACSFHPKINDNSRKIAYQRDQFFQDENIADEYSNVASCKTDQFLHLYDDAMKRIERHNKIYSMCIDSECTFKPDIGKTRHKYVGHRYNQSKQIVAEKSMIEKFNNDNFDPVTGQPFFHPKVGRSPSNKGHRSSKSIGNLLYNNHKLYKEKKDKLQQQHEEKLKEQMNMK
jgi:hypothetical protein